MKTVLNFLLVLIYPMLFCCVFASKDTLSTVVIDEIVEKIGKLTDDSLSNASPEEQQQVIEAIKDKFEHIAKRFTKNTQKYVNVLMEGIRLATYKYGRSKLKDIRSDIIQESTTIANLRKKTDNSKRLELNNQFVSNIANKIQTLSDKYVRSAKTVNEKIKVLRVIRSRIIELANKKYIILSRKNSPTKAYIKLIKKAVDLSLKKYLPLDSNTINHLSQPNKMDTIYNTEMDDDQLLNEVNGVTLENSLENVDKQVCENEVKKICFQVENLNKISCSSVPILIPIDKLCDDNYDCPDLSDERNCFKQVISRIQRANKALSSVEATTLRSCISSVDTTVLLSQSKVLNSVILAQIEFLKKYAYKSYLGRFNNRTMKTTANEVAVVIDSLTLAISGALCYSKEYEYEIELPNRRLNDIIDVGELDDELREKIFKPVSCQCAGKHCASKDCNKACENICWRKYSLTRWACGAIDGDTTVSLDLICDGKSDCLDGSDENECYSSKGSSKFEAIEIYNTIMKLLQEKEITNEYKSVRNQIIAMQKSVKDLLQASTSLDSSSKVIKGARSECFSSIVSTYNYSVNNAYTVVDIEDIYSFLLSINERLVSALKYSNTGNEKLFIRFKWDDNCQCKDSKCVSQCNNKCIRFCEAEPNLTKYFCEDARSNKSVAIEQICNGKAECLNGRDELNCRNNEFCRRHHVVMLNNAIKNMGQMQSATLGRELLDAWITKVNSTLMKIGNDEFDDRPIPKTMKKAMNEIIAELIQTYTNIEDKRRSTNKNYLILREFTKIAQTSMESLKSCGK